MPLTDCIHCETVPCDCGIQYESWTEGRLERQIRMLQNVLYRKHAANEANPLPMLKELHAVAIRGIEAGAFKGEYIPLRLDGRLYHLQFFWTGDSRGEVEFHIIEPPAESPRKIITLWPSGSVEEEVFGIRKNPARADEPVFFQSATEILRLVRDTLADIVARHNQPPFDLFPGF